MALHSFASLCAAAAITCAAAGCGHSILNVIGLRRNGVPAAERMALQWAFRAIYHGDQNTTEAIAAIRAQGEPTGLVKHFVEFIERIERGYRGRQNNPH